ncbi:MAG: RNA 2',3'-cyclic phosphodiesterase [Oleiphilaceae bacterium]|nr:RNA 2',3'-cyclic phosphodiesterase [Oleiphilaceae bacterium]
MASNNDKNPRLFLAAPVDQALAEALHQSLMASLDALPPLNPVAIENLHLTLTFIGACPAEKLRSTLLPALQPVLAEARPGRVHLRQVAGFPRADQARCLVAEGTPSETLRQWQQQLQEAVQSQLGNSEGQDGLWRPHITLARFRQTPETPVAATPWLQDLPVSEVILYQSETTPKGPVYQPLERWSLS